MSHLICDVATWTEAPTVKLLMMVSLTTAVRLPSLRRPMATWMRPTLRLTAVTTSRGEAEAGDLVEVRLSRVRRWSVWLEAAASSRCRP